MTTRRSLLLGLGALGAAGLFSTTSRGTATTPVAVELFTSQGCNSCPPADAFLGELAQRPDVVALAYHVDYWDYIGWRDPFGDARYTERQKRYADWLGKRMIYTPQMVVAGRWEMVGSRRGEVEAAIDKAKALPPGLTVAVGEDAATIAAGATPGAGATIWCLPYKARAATEVPSGENAGRRLVDYNIVQDIVPLGGYAGAGVSLPIDYKALRRQGATDCAILVQDDATGALLGCGKGPLGA